MTLPTRTPPFNYVDQIELENRTKRFALDVIALTEDLPRSIGATVMVGQLIRSACAVGAIYREANKAESRKDFTHKLGLVRKEAAESAYWLQLIIESKKCETPVVGLLLKEADELVRIFTAGVRTLTRDKSEIGNRKSEIENRK